MRAYALATTLGSGVVFGRFASLETFGDFNAARSKGLNFGKGVKEYCGGSVVAVSFMILLQTASVRRMLVRGYVVKSVGGIRDWV
jgi:hypothetical protein